MTTTTTIHPPNQSQQQAAAVQQQQQQKHHNPPTHSFTHPTTQAAIAATASNNNNNPSCHNHHPATSTCTLHSAYHHYPALIIYECGRVLPMACAAVAGDGAEGARGRGGAHRRSFPGNARQHCHAHHHGADLHGHHCIGGLATPLARAPAISRSQPWPSHHCTTSDVPTNEAPESSNQEGKSRVAN